MDERIKKRLIKKRGTLISSVHEDDDHDCNDDDDDVNFGCCLFTLLAESKPYYTCLLPNVNDRSSIFDITHITIMLMTDD